MTLPDFEVIGRVVLTDDAGATVDKLKSSMSGATSAGNAMGSSVEDAGKKTEEAHGKFSKLGEATSNLGNAFQQMGQAIMGGFVVGAVAKGVESAVKAAAAEQQQVALLSKTMDQHGLSVGTSTDSVVKWVNAQARATGISHDQLLPAMTNLVRVTGNVTQSQKLLGLAMDISAARGIPLKSVTQALMKASEGTVTSLSRYGIATKDASGKTMSFTAVMKAATAAYGGSAQQAANTTAGRIARMQESFSQLKEQLGQALLPVVNRLVGYLMAAVNVFSALPGPVKLGIVAVAALTAVGIGLSLLIPPLIAGFTALGGAIAFATGPVGLIILAIVGLIAIFTALWLKCSWFRDFWIGLWHDILKVGLVVWDAIKVYVMTYFNLYKLIITTVLKALEVAWDWTWNHVVKPILTTVWTIYVKPIFDAIKLAISGIQTVIGALSTAWSTAWNAMAQVVSSVWSKLKPIFSAVSGGLHAIGSAVSAVGGFLGGGSSGGLGGKGAQAGTSSGPADVQSMVNSMASSRGWSSADWMKVIMRESGGSMTAKNASSGAYGIAQGIDGPQWYAEHGGNANTLQGQLTAMANYIACMPLDTQILTRAGWKAPDEIRVGDETIGFDPQTETSHWTRVEAVHQYDDAPLVRLHNRRLDIRCTPNHRWLSEKTIQPQPGEQYRRFEFIATEAIGTRHRLRMAAEHVGDDALSLTLTEAELLGWLMGDGSLRRGENSRLDALIFQSKPRFVRRLRALLADIPHTEESPRSNGVIGFRFQAGFARDLLERSGYERDLEAMVLGMSGSQRRAFLDGLMGADGCQREIGSPVLAQNEGPKFDAAMLAIFLCGHYGHPTDSAGQKHVSLARPYLSGKDLGCEFDGREPVWCVTTGLGSWTAKQSGQVFLTGNSRYGNPTAAWQHELSAGWYDRGGFLPTGVSIAVNNTGRPEPVGVTASGGPHYHLHIHTSAQSEPIIQDFRLMETIYARST